MTTDPKVGEKLSLLDFAIQGSQHCKSTELIRPTPLQIPAYRNNTNSDELIKEEIDNEIQFAVIENNNVITH